MVLISSVVGRACILGDLERKGAGAGTWSSHRGAYLSFGGLVSSGLTFLRARQW